MSLSSNIQPPVRALSPGQGTSDQWLVVDAAGDLICSLSHQNPSVAKARALLISHLLGDSIPILVEIQELARLLDEPLETAARLVVRAKLLRLLQAFEGDR